MGNKIIGGIVLLLAAGNIFRLAVDGIHDFIDIIMLIGLPLLGLSLLGVFKKKKENNE